MLKTLGEAFVQVGDAVGRQIVSPNDAAAWTRALFTAASWPAGALAAVEQGNRTASLEDQTSVPGTLGFDLEQVTLVNWDVPTVPGLRVQSVELYQDAVIVRWAKLADDHNGPLVWALEDDARTEYRLVGGRGGSIGRTPWQGEILFTPTLPSGARRLQIQVNESARAITIERVSRPL